MKYGMHIFATTYSIQPGDLAREAEERGLDSVWFSEHTHIPTAYLESEEGRELPEYYWQAYDPFIAAAQAASATKSIKIGTGVSLFLQHDAIALAKTVATLDQISAGRFLFGVGTGWLRGEIENHGIAFAERYRMADEHIDAMKTLWTQEEPEFQGEHIKFSRCKSYPKPVQAPHPPLISGGSTGVKSLDFMARNCGGWMPILGIPDLEAIKRALPALEQRIAAHGKQMEAFELSAFSWEIPEAGPIAEMEGLGFRSINVSLGAKSRDEALRKMDRVATLI